MVGVAALQALVACAPTVRIMQPNVEAVAIDYRPLMQDGFLFSPLAYSGSHTPLGEVFVLAQAGARFDRATDDAYYSTWIAEALPIDSALAIAKAKTRELGGDALVNLRITPRPRTAGMAGTLSSAQVPGWEISGLAILRDR